MKKLRETLWADYNKVSEKLEKVNVQDKEYELLLGEQDKIRNELLKLEQANMEFGLKTNQIEAENKREKNRNYINLATFGVTTIISMYGLYKTFKFDEVATVTSTLGRNILNGVVPKMFKR